METFTKRKGGGSYGSDSYIQKQPLYIEVSKPIPIPIDLGITKDAKFSIRTLMLLSVMSIGVFLFGINPKLFGFELSSSLDIFAYFFTIIVIAQGIITFISYNLNRENVKAFITGLKSEHYKIKIQILNNQSEINDKEQKRIEILETKYIPSTQYHDTSRLDRETRAFEDNKEQNIKRLLEEEKFLKRMNVSLEAEKKNKESTIKNTELLYRYINGPAIFIIAAFSIVFSVFSIVTNESFIDYYSTPKEINTICLDINSINISNLIRR